MTSFTLIFLSVMLAAAFIYFFHAQSVKNEEEARLDENYDSADQDLPPIYTEEKYFDSPSNSDMNEGLMQITKRDNRNDNLTSDNAIEEERIRRSNEEKKLNKLRTEQGDAAIILQFVDNNNVPKMEIKLHPFIYGNRNPAKRRKVKGKNKSKLKMEIYNESAQMIQDLNLVEQTLIRILPNDTIVVGDFNDSTNKIETTTGFFNLTFHNSSKS